MFIGISFIPQSMTLPWTGMLPSEFLLLLLLAEGTHLLLLLSEGQRFLLPSLIYIEI